MKNPMGSLPGIRRRPRKPATMPRMIAPIMCNLLRLEGRWNYPAAQVGSHAVGMRTLPAWPSR